jgi:hypothetical protein
MQNDQIIKFDHFHHWEWAQKGNKDFIALKDMDFNPVNTTSISPLSIWVTLLMYIKVLQKLM